MKPAILLREKLNGPELVLGVLITNHLFLELIELSDAAGLDFAIIDLEHLDHGSTQVADALRYARALNFPVLVRPNESSFDAVRLAMDLGPSGLLLPMINSASQMDEVRDGLYLPPRGERRPGGPGNRWVNSYTNDEFRSQVEDHVIVVPQIESPLGLKNADEIASHEVTTALGIGPYDLSARLGICGQMDHPELLVRQEEILKAANRASKPAWIVGHPTVRRAQGFRFMCVAEPIMLLEGTLREIVKMAHLENRNTDRGDQVRN